MSDPFSEILRMCGARAVLTGGLHAGSEWALSFPRPQQIKFLAIAHGGGWLEFEGERQQLRLEAGDILLFGSDRAFTLRSHPHIEPVDAAMLFRSREHDIVSIGDEGEVRLIGGHVALDADSGWLLESYLPSFLHIGPTSPEAPTLRWLIDRLVDEGSAGALASGIASSQLAQLLFVHVLRALAAMPDTSAIGVLRAVSDPRLARALHLIHADLGRNWKLADLARAAGMSRTVFAERFRAAAGMTPIAYVTRWRMLLAARELKDSGTLVGELSRRLGYASESAFSQAFRRHMGVSPKGMGRRTD